MDYPVDANVIAFWPMDDDQNYQLNLASIRQAAAETSKAPDFGITATGVGQDIDIGSTATLRFERNNAFSISAWIIPMLSGLTGSVLSNCAVTTNRGYDFRILGNLLSLRLTNTAGSNEFIITHTGATLNDGLEHHIVLTYDGTQTQAGTKFYVDGVVRTTSAPSPNNLVSTIVSTGSLKIGKNGDFATINNFAGSIRHMSVWNVALTAGNVTTLFNSGTPGDLLSVGFAANLLTWWKILATDDYSVAGGIPDSASVGPFNGTAEGGLSTIPSIRLSAVNTARIPRISSGPRQELDLGQDNSRWFSLSGSGATTTQLRSGVDSNLRTGLAQSTKCLLGTAWTIEGWAYVDRDPTVLGATQSLLGFDQSGASNTQDLGTVKITSTKKLQITWESAGPTLRTATSTGDVPVQQWFHFAVIGIVNGANRDVQFYIAGVDAGLVTGLVRPTVADCTANCWVLGEAPTNANSLPLFGGLAYLRVSDVERSFVEISFASSDPANIENDVNTVAFWGLQERPHIRDNSPNGLHLIQRDIINGLVVSAPTDLFGSQGPSPLKFAHSFEDSASNTSTDGPTRQFVADALCNQNEYTIETLFRADYTVATDRVLYFCGGATGISSINSNIACQWKLLTNRKFEILWEIEAGFTQYLRSLNTAITLSGTQSGELGEWYGFALIKRAEGSFNYWKLDGSDDAVTMGNAAQLSFERTSPFTLIIWVNTITLALQHAIGKSESDATPQGYSLFLAADGRLTFRIEDNGGLRAQVATSVVSPAQANGTELCLAVTYSGSGLTSGIILYADGTALAVGTTTNTLEFPLATAGNQTEANTLLNSLKAKYNLHRANSPLAFHGVADATNVVAAANATNLATSITLANDIKTQYNAHLLNNGGAFHSVTDVANTITSANASDLPTVTTLANEARDRFTNHGLNVGGSYHLILDRSSVNTAPFTIGRRNLADQPLGGYIREASVWNRVLTASEISQAFGSAGRPPPDLLTTTMASALIGYWKFDQLDTGATIDDHSVSAVDGTPQGGFTPTSKLSSTWDFYVNGLPFETVGPMPDPIIGDVFSAASNQYFQSVHIGPSVMESRALTRLSDIARSDAEILQYYSFATIAGGNFNYKMRAVDDARIPPGYIYWIAPFPDFDAALVGGASPPLIGNVVPGSIVRVGVWEG